MPPKKSPIGLTAEEKRDTLARLNKQMLEFSQRIKNLDIKDLEEHVIRNRNEFSLLQKRLSALGVIKVQKETEEEVAARKMRQDKRNQPKKRKARKRMTEEEKIVANFMKLGLSESAAKVEAKKILGN